MALADLNRSNDTPIATLKLAEITPKDWPTNPSPVGSLALANQNAAKPRYSSMTDWAGGAVGDDVNQATAAVTIARSGGGANEPDYTPRTQADRATQLGTTLAVDVARARGWIEPRQPYGPVPAAPVVASISPTTAPQASLPLMVTITGTGFSVWSQVYTGGMPTPEAKAVFVNATTMKVPIWAAAPGTVSIAVKDHNVLSNTDILFTVT